MLTRLRVAFVAAALTLITLAVPQPSVAGEQSVAPCQGAYQDDSRLGPGTLPRPWQQPVGPLLAGYRRTGELTSAEFLRQYWDSSANAGQGSWRYPPLDGFRTDPRGEPIRWVGTVAVGVELDRFGSEFGSFLAPANTSYGGRALPPQSLFTFDPAYPCNYHRYRVSKGFQVLKGPAAAWFEQPGHGVQIKLERGLLPGEGRLHVAWLLDNGYLVRLH